MGDGLYSLAQGIDNLNYGMQSLAKTGLDIYRMRLEDEREKKRATYTQEYNEAVTSFTEEYHNFYQSSVLQWNKELDDNPVSYWQVLPQKFQEKMEERWEAIRDRFTDPDAAREAERYLRQFSEERQTAIQTKASEQDGELKRSMYNKQKESAVANKDFDLLYQITSSANPTVISPAQAYEDYNAGVYGINLVGARELAFQKAEKEGFDAAIGYVSDTDFEWGDDTGNTYRISEKDKFDLINGLKDGKVKQEKQIEGAQKKTYSDLLLKFVNYDLTHEEVSAAANSPLTKTGDYALKADDALRLQDMLESRYKSWTGEQDKLKTISENERKKILEETKANIEYNLRTALHGGENAVELIGQVNAATREGWFTPDDQKKWITEINSYSPDETLNGALSLLDDLAKTGTDKAAIGALKTELESRYKQSLYDKDGNANPARWDRARIEQEVKTLRLPYVETYLNGILGEEKGIKREKMKIGGKGDADVLSDFENAQQLLFGGSFVYTDQELVRLKPFIDYLASEGSWWFNSQKPGGKKLDKVEYVNGVFPVFVDTAGKKYLLTVENNDEVFREFPFIQRAGRADGTELGFNILTQQWEITKKPLPVSGGQLYK